MKIDKYSVVQITQDNIDWRLRSMSNYIKIKELKYPDLFMLYFTINKCKFYIYIDPKVSWSSLKSVISLLLQSIAMIVIHFKRNQLQIFNVQCQARQQLAAYQHLWHGHLGSTQDLPHLKWTVYYTNWEITVNTINTAPTYHSLRVQRPKPQFNLCVIYWALLTARQLPLQF